MLKWLKNYKIWNFHLFFSIIELIYNFQQVFLMIHRSFFRKCLMTWNLCYLLEEHDIWTRICSLAKVESNGFWCNPQSWHGIQTSVWLGLSKIITQIWIRVWQQGNKNKKWWLLEHVGKLAAKKIWQDLNLLLYAFFCWMLPLYHG